MSRRGHHEGTIYQRDDGRWVGAISLELGKRKYVYGSTRQEVQRKLAALRREVEAGLPLGDDRETVAHYFTSWLESVKRDIRPTTWARYEGCVRMHIIPRLGSARLTKLSPQHVRRWLGELVGDETEGGAGLQPSTAQITHGVLHRGLAEAVRMGMLPRNVASLVRAPRRGSAPLHAYTEAQARQFLAYVESIDLRRYAFYVLALSTGMRAGELLGLAWEQVDLHAGTVQVVAQVIYLNGKRTLAEPKTASSRRRIRIDPRVCEVLRQHRARQHRERLLAGGSWQETGLVFTTQLGGILPGPQVCGRKFHVLQDAAGVPRIRFHDLRHTAATMALSRGVNTKMVAEMLGHSSVVMTLDRYSHVQSDMQRTVSNQLADALLGS